MWKEIKECSINNTEAELIFLCIESPLFYRYKNSRIKHKLIGFDRYWSRFLRMNFKVIFQMINTSKNMIAGFTFEYLLRNIMLFTQMSLQTTATFESFTTFVAFHERRSGVGNISLITEVQFSMSLHVVFSRKGFITEIANGIPVIFLMLSSSMALEVEDAVKGSLQY